MARDLYTQPTNNVFSLFGQGTLQLKGVESVILIYATQALLVHFWHLINKPTNSKIISFI